MKTFTYLGISSYMLSLPVQAKVFSIVNVQVECIQGNVVGKHKYFCQ